MRILALLVLVLVLVDAAAPAQTTPAPLAITHGPSLQLPTATSITVVWHTSRRCVSRVEFGEGDALGQTAVSSRHGLIDNDRTSHLVRLEGLRPGTGYSYRVVSTEFLGYERQHIVQIGETVTSEVHRFTTLDPQKEAFSFCMISDLHERAAELAAWTEHPSWQGVDFVVFNGDMINDFMRPEQVFTGFLDVAVQTFATERPLVFARGNHETRGRFARTLDEFLATQDGRAYYSFDHGGVHFVVLDSGEDKEDGHEYYNGLVDFARYRQEQARWLAEDLASEACLRARHRIVISHIPPRPPRGFGAEDTQRRFEPLAEEAGVDLWLSGHRHRYGRIDPTPGENSYTLLTGAHDTTTRVEVSERGLEVSVVRVGGEVLDEFLLPPGG